MTSSKLQPRLLRGALGLGLGSLFLGAMHFGGESRLESALANLEDAVKVTDKIHILPNPRAGNIGLQHGPDGLLMIDDQFMDDVGNTEAAIAKLKSSAPLYLVNTHWHNDHTGANRHFGSSATILAHRNVRRRLADEPGIEGRTVKDSPAVALPEVTYETGLSLHFNGEEIELRHVPRAHTDGDTVVWFKGSKVVQMGDLFFASGYPFIDVNSGGNALGLVEGLQGILRWIPADAQVIPGHGALTDVPALRRYVEMLELIVGRVQELAQEDFELAEIIEAGVSEEFDAQWGRGFISPERLIESIFLSLPK